MKSTSNVPKGLSIHLGVNNFDAKHYHGWQGNLTQAETDAEDLANIAQMMGFETKVLLGKEATVNRVSLYLKNALKNMETNDILFLTFSGYAGFLPVITNKDRQDSKKTWCLYDAQLMQDAITAQFVSFNKKVRVLILSDCGAYNPINNPNPTSTCFEDAPPKSLPESISLGTYLRNKDYYDSQVLKNLNVRHDGMPASIQWLNACHDNQTAIERKFNGLLTATIKSVWRGGNFDRPYNQFFKQIRWRTPAYQTPELIKMGKPNSGFYQETPFQI
ncbi:MAG TPA: hypothetical protein ENJ95_09030 [Bacteroidetes bacterium]|nr:hypothetical protein [Bacteroidota bacterium]